MLPSPHLNSRPPSFIPWPCQWTTKASSDLTGGNCPPPRHHQQKGSNRSSLGYERPDECGNRCGRGGMGGGPSITTPVTGSLVWQLHEARIIVPSTRSLCSSLSPLPHLGSLSLQLEDIHTHTQFGTLPLLRIRCAMLLLHMRSPASPSRNPSLNLHQPEGELSAAPSTPSFSFTLPMVNGSPWPAREEVDSSGFKYASRALSILPCHVRLSCLLLCFTMFTSPLSLSLRTISASQLREPLIIHLYSTPPFVTFRPSQS
ncbi:hypothetical protein CDEST_00091 [Colletotrichum destructivum]|uniref:Uncharacterized protein n=1 Tax=Colletotrichum destructivum TaxID=34406 RepID=A0AAX4HWD7_9PEZI|nr:hypothetical protein CDEST_00091 [Colletotrichum destructivum]